MISLKITRYDTNIFHVHLIPRQLESIIFKFPPYNSGKRSQILDDDICFSSYLPLSFWKAQCVLIWSGSLQRTLWKLWYQLLLWKIIGLCYWLLESKIQISCIGSSGCRDQSQFHGYPFICYVNELPMLRRMGYWKDQILSVKNVKFKRFSIFYEIPSLSWENFKRGILGTLEDTNRLVQPIAHRKEYHLSNFSEI